LITGSLLTILFHKDDYNYRAVGASGAVTGVLYSAILLRPDMMLASFYNSDSSLPFGILYLLYSIYRMRAKNDNIEYGTFWRCHRWICNNLITNPHLLIENTLMVVLLTILSLLFVMDKWGSCNGINIEIEYIFNQLKTLL
jgi:hypothetical protein